MYEVSDNSGEYKMKNVFVSLACCALLSGCESSTSQVKPEAVDTAVADVASPAAPVASAPEAVSSAAPAPAASATEVLAPAASASAAPDAAKK